MAFFRLAYSGIVGKQAVMKMAHHHQIASRAICSSTRYQGRDKLADYYRIPEPQYQWNSNWDYKEPSEEHRIAPATATRYLILVRHGQYHTGARTEEEKTLTTLGQEQATEVGKRLVALNYQFTKIISSTKVRALETANFIAALLPPDTPMEYCSLIEEGAPIPPEPKTTWKPERSMEPE
ncbi:hypothetical protein EB796_023305 [Bugula neritina]|uniref:Serine/threonine-protein phosphatase PGAM5, mitochondrial n=1 Tax=Bugula neritina TaxID=10212 RepID=A0A7J7IWT2_BUGNE|nr:hypothetical protein EB796_023305 [Bugula neritina]